MISSQVYRRYLMLGISVAVIVVILGMVSAFLVSRIGNNKEREFPKPQVFFARILYALDSHDAANALQLFDKATSDTDSPFKVLLLDEQGKPLVGAKINGAPSFLLQELPTRDFEVQRLHEKNFADPMMGGIVRMPYDPPRFLMLRPNLSHNGHRPPAPFGFLPPVFIALLVSMLLGIAIAILMILFSIRKRVDQADNVIARLRAGDLKARFVIERNDEFGKAMQRFNRMAEEIEHLVERLRHAEKGRVILLQDLAHDLRTPIASMLTVVETLRDKEDKISATDRAKLFSLATREIEYFDRLVDDLLFLALVSEPNYKTDKCQFDLLLLIENEIEVASSGFDGRSKSLLIPFRHGFKRLELSGDLHLFQRVVRNALSNACSFAQKQVIVRVTHEEKVLTISFEDDGPGFPEQKILNFGQRKFSRVVNQENEDRISVGLGSVIMRVVSELHGGTISAKNLHGGETIFGAVIAIKLPEELIAINEAAEVTKEFPPLS